MLHRLLIAVCTALFAVTAFAQPPEVPEGEQARYHALIAELRCVICQNRSIAESDAPLANDMRQIVVRQMQAGRSDSEIKDYLVQRYGEFVLYNPRFSTATWVLWLGPPTLLIIGILVVFLLWRRTTKRTEPKPPDADKIARLLDQDS